MSPLSYPTGSNNSSDVRSPGGRGISPELRSPLKWHGGKHYLAKDIVHIMPHSSSYVHYVEPYAGGLSVLLQRLLGHSEVVNDLCADLTNFWRVLQSPKLFGEFQRVVEVMPFSQVEWDEAFEATSSPDAGDIPLNEVHPNVETAVERAVRFFVLCRQSLAGRMDTFAPLSRSRTRRGMNEQASAWLTTVEGLPEVHARLKSVVVYNRPAMDVIKSEDSKHTLFYLDPPYPVESRSGSGKSTASSVYKYDMTEDDHQALLELITQCEGKFILSSYPNALYDEVLPECQSPWADRWRRCTFNLPNNAAGGKKKHRETEVLWLNY